MQAPSSWRSREGLPACNEEGDAAQWSLLFPCWSLPVMICKLGQTTLLLGSDELQSICWQSGLWSAWPSSFAAHPDHTWRRDVWQTSVTLEHVTRWKTWEKWANPAWGGFRAMNQVLTGYTIARRSAQLGCSSRMSVGLLAEMLVGLFAEWTDFLRNTMHNNYLPLPTPQVLW